MQQHHEDLGRLIVRTLSDLPDVIFLNLPFQTLENGKTLPEGKA